MLVPRAEVPGCKCTEGVVVGLQLLVGGELPDRAVVRWMLVSVVVAVGVGVRACAALPGLR